MYCVHIYNQHSGRIFGFHYQSTRLEAANLMQHPTDRRWNSICTFQSFAKAAHIIAIRGAGGRKHHTHQALWRNGHVVRPLLRPDPNEVQAEHWLVRLMWGWWCSQGVKPCTGWSRSRSNSKPKFLISFSASVRAMTPLHIQQTLSRRASLWPTLHLNALQALKLEAIQADDN